MSESQEVAVPEAEKVVEGTWEALRHARESLGLSVGDVSAHLKLTVRQIDAIERGDLSVLPGAAFARGFVRNYARFLGLDPVQFMQAMEANASSDTEALASRMNPEGLGQMPFKGTHRFASLPMAVGVLALLIVLLLGAYFRWFESKDDDLLAQLQAESAPYESTSGAVAAGVGGASSVPAASVSPPIQPALQSAAVSVAQVLVPKVVASSGAHAVVQSIPAAAKQSEPIARQSVPVNAKQTAPAQSAPQVAQSANGAGLLLSFEGDSWVEVRDAAGKSVLSRLNPAGSSQTVQGTPPFTLVVGNAGKVKLVWRGKPVDLTPYIKVDVARLSLQ